MSKKSDEQKWIEQQIRQNILKALNQKQPSILRDKNGKEIGEFNIGELFSIKEGKIHVDFGQIGLKTKGNFVGMGYILYSPEIFGGSNVQNVLDSWDWLIRKIQVNEETLQIALEACSLSLLLLTGVDMGTNIYIFSLIVDLYELDSLGVDTSAKIAEIGKQIRSYMRIFEKLKDIRIWKALFRTEDLRLHLSNVSSECRLARIAKRYGFDVKLGVHPDLTINGKKVEVKRISSFDRFASLSNPIEEGLNQNPDIIAIEVNSLEKRNIKGFKTKWFGRGNLRSTLETALAFKRNGNCILLFSGTTEGLEGRIILLK